MQLPIQATFVKAGDRFRVHHDGYTHQVMAVQPNDDLTLIHIAFDDPQHTVRSFHPLEPVILPRRKDGSVRFHKEPPFPHEVFPGDTLPYVMMYTDWNPDGTEKGKHRIKMPEPITIMAVKAVMGSAVPIYDVSTMYPNEPGWRRYRFLGTHKVEWPREPDTDEYGIRAAKTGEIEWMGPYKHRDTGALFYFAEHPTGRGRWPRGIEKYDRNKVYEPIANDGAYYMRFPRYDWDPLLEPTTPGLVTGHVIKYTRRLPNGFMLS